MKQRRVRTLWETIRRILRHKLIVPLLRSPHPPEYKAHGVAVGFAWSMTPLVGIQMWLVFMTWTFVKKVCHKSFSLPLALAWTWVTNVFTMVPIYYVFYVTGQLMQGNFDCISGYDSLKIIIVETFTADYTFWEKWALFFKMLLKDWGLAMAVGCLPWAVIAYICGYFFTLKFERVRVYRRELKQQKRALNEASQ